MIYNLTQYLVVTFPLLNFVVDAWNKDSPDDCIKVMDSGGTDGHDSGRPDITVQFLSRSKKHHTSRSSISMVYGQLKNRIGLVLPEVTIDSVVYPELKTYRIVPIQYFGYIGTSSESHHMYSFNSIVTLDYS